MFSLSDHHDGNYMQGHCLCLLRYTQYYNSRFLVSLKGISMERLHLILHMYIYSHNFMHMNTGI